MDSSPQATVSAWKKNPNPMELFHRKSTRAVGDMVTLLVLWKALPHAYNHDLQEDKELVFDNIKTITGMLEVCAEIAHNIAFNREKIKETGHFNVTTFAHYLTHA